MKSGCRKIRLLPKSKEVLEKETQRLMAIIPANSYVILLDVIGKQISSPELAEKLML